MNRRTVLLIVAVVIALLGTALVFVYVRGADQRAEDQFDTVDVLTAVAPIEPGESIDDAATNGKLAMEAVAQSNLLPNHQTSIEALSGSVATTRIYAGEQIISDKFGSEVEATTALAIPKGMIAVSVNLTDTARVAGFVSPGTRVAIFLNGTDDSDNNFTRLLLEEVEVIAVGSTSTTQTTTTTPEGTQTTEELPKTLMTLALDQDDAEKVLFSQTNGELVFGLMTEDSNVNSGPGVTTGTLFR
ncbi:Flp pilus assembly protein CpaB [Nocardioides coralli]|uniref:Flp pilus assembly protein CpaB n=1 Tax=Nocardioides coralli TaxID=2872154 RepID=UPI001CA4508A|nr:Flp pilus assembly protein CpaB [Nocardioides coralli]QZY28010.1 Flp pilus assembly protein CpaB [Nocardioides coralli]